MSTSRSPLVGLPTYMNERYPKFPGNADFFYTLSKFKPIRMDETWMKSRYYERTSSKAATRSELELRVEGGCFAFQYSDQLTHFLARYRLLKFLHVSRSAIINWISCTHKQWTMEKGERASREITKEKNKGWVLAMGLHKRRTTSKFKTFWHRNQNFSWKFAPSNMYIEIWKKLHAPK